MISCLTVTRETRFRSLELAVGDFARQTWAERELVIVHDGDAAFDVKLKRLAAAHDAARGETVCQWDDDDRYHPRRLEFQFAAMRVENSEFCFLTDQLHLFAAERTMYWDDWNLEVHPLNLVQGTLLGRSFQQLGRSTGIRGTRRALP
jgi:hypothetical protein